MRAALITIAPPSASVAAGPVLLAGKSLARRQLDFALAAGCRQIIAFGPNSLPEAVALRRVAEDRGARFMAIVDSTGLSGALGADDELLVLMSSLVPESAAMLQALSRGPIVLVLPAASGTAAGFERIDLDRAWAGAAMVPGTLIERLAELPADIDPASALMRAALQTHVPEHAVPEDLVAAGQWTPWQAQLDPAADKAWLLRHSALLRALPERLSTLATSFAGRALGSPRLVPLAWLSTALVLLVAVLTSWLGHPAPGFALVGLGAILGRLTQELGQLRQAPFGRPSLRLPMIAAVLLDLAITACACMAIEGSWPQRLFPPLVLMAALHLPATSTFAAALRKRALLAGVLALAAALGIAEPAIMAAGLALIMLGVPYDPRERGITRD
jgi:hypothetical protein